MKDTWIDSFNSVTINPEGLNETVHVAVVFSILGLLHIKSRGKGVAAKFIPTLKKED